MNKVTLSVAALAAISVPAQMQAAEITQADVQASFDRQNVKLNAVVRALDTYHADVKAEYLDKLSEIQGKLNAELKASQDAVAAGKDPIALKDYLEQIEQIQTAAINLEKEYDAYDIIYPNFYGEPNGLNKVYNDALTQVQNGNYPNVGKKKKEWLEGLGFAGLKDQVDALDPKKGNVASSQSTLTPKINIMRASIKNMLAGIGQEETNAASNKDAYEQVNGVIALLKESYNEQLQGILKILPGDPDVYGDLQAQAIAELNDEYRKIVEVQNLNKEQYDKGEAAGDNLTTNLNTLSTITGVVNTICENYTNLKSTLETANDGFKDRITTLETSLKKYTDALTERKLTELDSDVSTIKTAIKNLKENLLSAYKKHTVADNEYSTTFDNGEKDINALIGALAPKADALCANYDAYQDCLTEYQSLVKALEEAVKTAGTESKDKAYKAVDYFNGTQRAINGDISTLLATIEAQYVAKTAVTYKNKQLTSTVTAINTAIGNYEAATAASLTDYNKASKLVSDSKALVAELEKVSDKTVTVDGQLASESYQQVITTANEQIKKIEGAIEFAKQGKDDTHKTRMADAAKLKVRTDLQALIDNYDANKKEFDKNASVYAADKMLEETGVSIQNINKRINDLTNDNTEAKYGNGQSKITEALTAIQNDKLTEATNKYNEEKDKYDALLTAEEKAEEAPAAKALLNEVNNTLSEVVKALDELEKDAAAYAANKAAYDRVSAKAAVGSTLATFITEAKTYIQNNTTAVAGTTFFVTEVTKQENLLISLRTQIDKSYAAYKSVETEEGYNEQLKAIEDEVTRLKKDAVLNDQAYKTVTGLKATLQKNWQDTYTKIAESDQSSIAKDYLAKLGQQQDAINALAASIEDALKTGKCDDNEKDIKAEIEKINAAIKEIADTQAEGYNAAIAADNLAEHNKYINEYNVAYKVFQNAVESLNKLSSITNAASKIALENYIGTHDAIYKYAEELRKSSANELAAYNKVVSPDLYSAETEIGNVKGFASAIDKALQDYQDAVNAVALANYKTLIETAVSTLGEYETSISGYHTDSKKDAFKDVHEFVDAAQTAAGLKEGTSVSRMFAYEIDSWLNKLEANTVKNMCIADREAAATKEFNYYHNIFTTKYQEETTDIEKLEGIDVTVYTTKLNELKKETIDAAYNQFFYYTKLTKFDTLESCLELLNKFYGEDKDKEHSDVWTLACVDSQEAVDNINAYNRIIGYLDTANKEYNDALEALKPLYVAHQNGTWLDNQLKGILAKIEGYQQTVKDWKSAQTCVDNESEVQEWVNPKLYESIQQTLELIKAQAINIEITTLSDECDIVEEKYNQVIKLDAKYIGEWSKKWSAEITKLYKTLLITSKTHTNNKNSIEYRWNDGKLTFDQAKAELVTLESEIARVGATFTDIYDKTAYGLAVEAVNDKADEVNQNIAQLESWVGDEFTAVTEKYSAEVEYVRGLYNFVAADVESKDAAHQVLFYQDNLIADYDDVQKVVDGITPGLEAMYNKYFDNKSYKSKYDSEISTYKTEFERVKTEIADFEFSHDYTYTENGKTITTTYREYMIAQITKEFETAEKAINEKYEKVELTGNDDISTGYINYLIGELEKTAKYDEAKNTYLPNVEKKLEAAKTNMGIAGRLYNDARKDALNKEYDRINTLLGYAKTYNKNVYNEGTAYKDLEGNKLGVGDFGIHVQYLGETVDEFHGGWLRVKARAEELLENAQKLVSDVDEYYYIVGDADNDKRVTVNDYSEVRGWILTAKKFEDVSEAQRYAGDVNCDEEFTVGDMTGISNLIFYNSVTGPQAGAPSRARAFNASADQLTVANESEETTIFGKTVRMAVSLDNAEAFTAGQMDIILPQGMKLAGQSLSSRANGHELLANEIAGGTYRLVASTVENNAFNGSNGALIYLDVEVGSDYNGGNITIDNVIFSDAQANSYYLTNNGPIVPTGIEGIEAASVKERIYSVGGQMMKAVKKGINIIVGENNETKKVVK